MDGITLLILQSLQYNLPLVCTLWVMSVITLPHNAQRLTALK